MSVTTIQKLRRSIKISERLKAHLETLLEQELRPIPLTKWSKIAFDIAREQGDDLLETRKLVEVYARSRHYSSDQISVSLPAEVKKKYKPKSDKGRKHLKPSFRKMVQNLTGLDDARILMSNGRELAEKSRAYRLDIISKWGKSEIEEVGIEARRLVHVLTDLVKQLDAKEEVLKHGVGGVLTE